MLKTVLQRHGVQIIEAVGGDDGLDLARQCHPDVVVLDVDSVDVANQSVCDGFNGHMREENTAVVLLGTIPAANRPLRSSETIAKPYHYGPLIRKIEELLQQADKTVETPPG